MTAADPASFLQARLDEDERTATAAEGDAAEPGDGSWVVARTLGRAVKDANGNVVVYDEGSPTPEEAEHIARHDPARVLREVRVKRRIAGLHVDGHICVAFDTGERRYVKASETCAILGLLAMAYIDHPDYREEWGP